MRRLSVLLLGITLSCTATPPFDPDEDLAVGPGGMVGHGAPITDGNFAGGNDVLPSARAVPPPDDTRPPDCDAACIAWCDAQGLTNPVNKGLCRSLWGVGLEPRPIDDLQACRRLFVDFTGRLPTPEEAAATCTGNYGDAVKKLMATEAFVTVNQRRAADTFLYSNEVVSVQAIYDMDRLVAKLVQGRVPWDLFASIAASHPVLTRRFADPGDTVEAVFERFVGRPPFENERADLGRLYALWEDGYNDHPQLNMRLPDAFLRFRCLTEEGEIDANRRGECASVLYGYNEVILTPDIRAAVDVNSGVLRMWQGLITPEEWRLLQIPGRVLSRELAFWEKAVGDVLVQYLGYDLAQRVPEVQQELVAYLLENKGDIRSVHFAVATSIAYLQSIEGESTARYPWTYGPMKQLGAEVWIDSIARAANTQMGACDHRIAQPESFLDSSSLASYRVLQKSRWAFDDEGDLDTDYADLARTLGGCPENVVGGRFTVLSILTTATQLAVVNQVCNPGEVADVNSGPIESLLPPGLGSARAVDPQVAQQIAEHQYRTFLGRSPQAIELQEAIEGGEECARALCTAEEFARPLCFALLSSADVLFY